jgi:hypothetical protein
VIPKCIPEFLAEILNQPSSVKTDITALDETVEIGRKCFAGFPFATPEGVRNIREGLDEAGNGGWASFDMVCITKNCVATLDLGNASPWLLGCNDPTRIPRNQSAGDRCPMKKIFALFGDEERKQLSYLGSMLRREPSEEEEEQHRILDAIVDAKI